MSCTCESPHKDRRVSEQSESGSNSRAQQERGGQK